MFDKSDTCSGGSTPEPWLLVEEITHRVANEYSAAIASISRAAMRCASLDARIALTDAARSLLGSAEVHRALQPPPAAAPADLSQHLRGLCGAIVRARLSERKINLTLVEDAIELESEQCWLVGMIVSELITNAARHGLRHRGGSIVVALSSTNRTVRCRVTDDGSSINPAPGRGTRIIGALAHELGGTIGWRFSASGTTVLLCFPRDVHVCPLDA